jgi:hypothetical protein
VPVFCGEFGVYRKVSPPADRLRWIADVRRSLESLGIGWSMWDYETDFGLVSYDEPSWRRGIRVDSACLAALGLDPSATIEPRPDEPTLADFVSGAVDRIDIPVDAWSRLWTRDPGSGVESAIEDAAGRPEAVELSLRGERDWSLGSGLAVPVKPGEEFRLSARAAVEGPGSLRLEFVARDATGKVISWDYGSVAAPALAADAPVGNGAADTAAGPAAEPPQTGAAASPGSLLVTEVVVARAVASLEPRWSGSGRATLRLGSFTLERAGRVAGPSARGPLKLSNGALELDFDPADARFAVRDLRSGRLWEQIAAPGAWSAATAGVEGESLGALLVDERS